MSVSHNSHACMHWLTTKNKEGADWTLAEILSSRLPHWDLSLLPLLQRKCRTGLTLVSPIRKNRDWIKCWTSPPHHPPLMSGRLHPALRLKGPESRSKLRQLQPSPPQQRLGTLELHSPYISPWATRVNKHWEPYRRVCSRRREVEHPFLYLCQLSHEGPPLLLTPPPQESRKMGTKDPFSLAALWPPTHQ